MLLLLTRFVTICLHWVVRVSAIALVYVILQTVIDTASERRLIPVIPACVFDVIPGMAHRYCYIQPFSVNWFVAFGIPVAIVLLLLNDMRESVNRQHNLVVNLLALGACIALCTTMLSAI